MSDPTPDSEQLDTLPKYLLEAKERNGTGAAADVLHGIGVATRAIAHKVRRARLGEDILGSVGVTNIQGEDQQKLDVIANELLIQALSGCPHVGVVASEEEDLPLVVRPASEGGAYGVLFDPLDGSSNVNVAAGVGTIFSILRVHDSDDDAEKSVLQAGNAQVGAGYVLYGSSVLLVLTLGHGVDMFVLDPDLDEFVLVETGVQIPREQKIRSINGAYRADFSSGYQAYLAWTEKNGYGSRYIGSMVADVHRTLLKGGVFLYPATTKAPAGKLRLMYEANPMSLVVEQAGGSAVTGGGRLLDVVPDELHQRIPVVLGSACEVEKVLEFL